MKGIRFGAAILSIVALAASGCGEFLTSADLTQTAEPAIAAPAETATATPATEATATATPTVGVLARAPEVARFPTPSSPSDTMILGGGLWVDARPASGEVLAFINGKQCGRGQSVRLPSEPPDPFPIFVIEIASDVQQPGCGVPGAAVTITVGGRPMNDTVEWRPGFQQQVNLIAGPAFAQYTGVLQVQGVPPLFKVVAYIDGTACGEDTVSMIVPDTVLTYQIIVDPEELRPGCGRDGVDVTLQIEFGTGDVALRSVIGTAPWQMGPVALPNIDLPAGIPTTPFPPVPAR